MENSRWWHHRFPCLLGHRPGGCGGTPDVRPLRFDFVPFSQSVHIGKSCDSHASRRRTHLFPVRESKLLVPPRFLELSKELMLSVGIVAVPPLASGPPKVMVFL